MQAKIGSCYICSEYQRCFMCIRGLLITVCLVTNTLYSNTFKNRYLFKVLGSRVAQWVRSLDLTTHATWVRARLCKLQKGCTRLAAASDKVYQLLAHGRWFSPGTPASSTTKTVRHDIAEILLKVALKHQKSNQIKVLSINEITAFTFLHNCSLLF